MALIGISSTAMFGKPKAKKGATIMEEQVAKTDTTPKQASIDIVLASGNLSWIM